MQFRLFFFLVLLGFLYLSLAQGSYEDCCLRYVSTINHHIQRKVTVYRRQELDGGCNIPAIVFTTVRGRRLCANPKQKWVHKLIEKIDKRKGSRG